VAHHSLELFLRRDRHVAIGSLLLVTGLAWAYVLSGAAMPALEHGMAMTDAHGDMMPMPTAWTLSHAMLMALMWWIMMIAMMVPSAAPMILLFVAISRKQQAQSDPFAPTGIFLAAYLVVWGAFSLVATGLQWALDTAGLLSAMAVTNAVLGESILLAAGLYQLTPLKQACLRRCRGPVQFLSESWRPGAAGALRMGLAHGLYCLGCCWFLMALLFFGGIMNVLWIAGLAIYVLFEKTVPAGHWLAQVAGVLLVAAGTIMVVGA
jgi:predicted metal-binding membrane protein